MKILTLSATHTSHIEGDVYYAGSTGIGKIYPHARVRTAYAGNLIKELIEWSPDVVHSQSEFSTFFMAKRIARACSCPLIHTYHTVYEKYTQYFSPNEAMGRHMAGIFSRRVLAPVDSVIVPTAKVKTLLEGYGVSTPIYEVPTGLDLSRLERKDGTPSVTRADFGISSQDTVFIYTGRLAKEKNINELLELMRVEAPEGSKLLLVGDGPYREFLEDYVYRLDMQGRLQDFIAGFGLLGMFVFIVFQAVQVVVPVIPGGLSCLAGVILFGAWKGFLCNYIGICAGSVIAFLIAKQLGRPLMEAVFKKKQIEKYENWTTENNRFTKLFALAIFLPLAPDDFLCYLAGTTKMKLGSFTGIILAGKPAAIALYSLGLMTVFSHMTSLIGG